jgi:hypothetical protein
MNKINLYFTNILFAFGIETGNKICLHFTDISLQICIYIFPIFHIIHDKISHDKNCNTLTYIFIAGHGLALI